MEKKEKRDPISEQFREDQLRQLMTPLEPDGATEILSAEVASEPPLTPPKEKSESSVNPVIPLKNQKISKGLGKSPSDVFDEGRWVHLLQVAQAKIEELEKEVDKLREEKEMMSIAAITQKKQLDDYIRKLESQSSERHQEQEKWKEEVQLLRQIVADKDRERRELAQEVLTLKSELSQEVRRIRGRERDLENRLEILKQEKVALLRAKDQQILQLKERVEELEDLLRQQRLVVDQMQKDNKILLDQVSRTVKTLRLLLTHLESESPEQEAEFKKAK